jgi:AbrB family looped-hinge helix DNA binding protein
MAIAQSKLTAQGQVSIPAEVRRKLGITSGAVLEWDERDGEIIVRRAARHSSEDIRRALFPEGKPKAHTPENIREGIRGNIRKRHARS